MVRVSGDINEESSIFEAVKFISDNEVRYGTDATLPDISYKYIIDRIHNVNKIIDNNIIIKEIFLPPQGKYIEVICAQVKPWAAQFDQDQEVFVVSVREFQDTDIMA